jgi:predicted aldo/keto reductase-like oxidoreductase
LSPNGSLEACKKARSEGLVDYIGITGHKPLVLVEAIKTNEFDTVLVPINVVTRQALEELVPLAKSLDVGVAAMKPLSAKTSNLITCLYKPSLSLFFDEPDLKRWLGEDKVSRIQRALIFVLAQDIATAVVGMRSIDEVEVAIDIGNKYGGLTSYEEELLKVKLEEHCRDCGLCLPCPQNLNIPAILRFHMLYEAYNLKNWAKKLYDGLEVGADKCIKCGECEPKCPYNLPITEMLEKACLNLS